MKRSALMAALLLPLLSKAQDVPCVVNLDIDTVKARIAYLVYMVGEKSIVDSPLIRNGKATFRANIPYPVMGQLSLDNKGYGYTNGNRPDLLRFYLEKGTMTIRTNNRVTDATIKGSKLNTELLEYYRFIKEPMDGLENGNYVWMTETADYRKDTNNMNAFMSKTRADFKQLTELQEQWIKAHPDAQCSLLALQNIAGSNINVPKVSALFDGLSARLRNSRDGKTMGDRIAAARQTAIGAMAPVFTQNDVNDKPVSLFDFRGKYILIDFWASWCGPCRAENPNYVKAYNQYKDKNFTILGVSLDQKGQKNAWIAAIKKDGLEWPQVSDLNYWNNAVARQYDVKAVPTNYLIDPAGKIIAKNLRGEALQQKLAELLGGTQTTGKLLTDSSFAIHGYLAGAPAGTKIFLRYGQQADSTTLENGRFSFSGFVKKPVSAYVYSADKNESGPLSHSVNFFLEPVNITINGMGTLDHTVVIGGPTEAEQQLWKSLVKPYEEKRGALMTRKYQLRDNEDSVLALTKQIAGVQEEVTKLAVKFVTGFPRSYFSYDMMVGYSYGIDPNVLEPMLNSLDPALTNTEEVKDIRNRLDIARLTRVGKPALEFTQADVNGKPVALSSFRGKYVMVDFWASWCGWCRIENPNLIKAYNKYKDKGFTVLGVSLDDAKDKDKWIEAIKKDGLPWQQVCDLKGRNNEVAKMYGIKGIPQSLLIGPDGKIVARNLRGDDLLLKLREIFGS